MELKYATVLVVDDETMLLDIFREWLQEQGCRVLTAENGAAAFETLIHHCVNLIVSDVRMPVMDGILLLKNLTAYANESQTSLPKMIFITGFTDLEMREAYNLGVEAILQKPITRAQFVGAIQHTLCAREETWAETPAPGGFPLHIALPRLSAAIEQGRIAFGRGGFCLRRSSPIQEGRVRFDLEFEGEELRFSGHGVIRWTDPDERTLGVEITNLDEPCREWAINLIASNAGSSYIPRAPLSAAPRVRTAR